MVPEWNNLHTVQYGIFSPRASENISPMTARLATQSNILFSVKWQTFLFSQKERNPFIISHILKLLIES
jgi:hypothetical protein